MTQQGKYAQEHDFFYPGHQAYTDYFLPVTVRSIDPYKANERAWWWQHSQDAFDKGIVGWWNDETDKVSSGDAQYWFGNFSTMFISQALYEGQRNYTGGEPEYGKLREITIPVHSGMPQAFGLVMSQHSSIKANVLIGQRALMSRKLLCSLPLTTAK